MPSPTNLQTSNSPQTYNRIGLSSSSSFIDAAFDSNDSHSSSSMSRSNSTSVPTASRPRSRLSVLHPPHPHQGHTRTINNTNNTNNINTGFIDEADIEIVSEETIDMNYLGGNTRQSLNQPLSFDENENEQDGLEMERPSQGRGQGGSGGETETAEVKDDTDAMQDGNGDTESENVPSPWGRMGGNSNGERRRMPGFRAGPRSVFNAISSTSPNSSRPTSPSSPSTSPSTSPSQPSSSSQPNIPETHKITLTILDSAQKKFELIASIKWTTKQLKTEGQKIHSIPPSQQRLISMGKLLQDDKSLEDQGIGISYQNSSGNTSGSGSGNGNGNRAKAIIHLFPKPNVVISNNNNNHNQSSESNTNETSNNNETNNNNRAHVPQIILDSEEITRRGQILVLSSHEAYEAMHRVRLLSFLLLAYSTLQILRDVTIYLAPPNGYLTDDVIPPGDPTDTSSGTYDQGDELPEWQNRDYIEMAIACLGVYVALLGMKATTDHIAYLAKKFLILLGILGISWTLYTFYCHVLFNLALEKALGENDRDHLAMRVSLLETTLPFFLWVMFYVRALQFYILIREAEMEANERVLGFLPSVVNHGEGGVDGDVEVGDGDGNGGNRRNGNHDHHDLELQVEHGTIT